MNSNGNFTVWIGGKCFSISFVEVEQIRSHSDSNLNCFSDLAIAAMIAESQFDDCQRTSQIPFVNVLNRHEIQLLAEVRQSIKAAG